jgi:hypothetical protein
LQDLPAPGGSTNKGLQMMNRSVGSNFRPHNNGLHQTGRGGAAVSLCRRPVVEARPAGEAGCCTDAWAAL